MAVVYIDVDDEITTVAARLRRLPDARVALVVPPGSRVATSRINFRLLAREAAGNARSLAIVTPDPAVRALAGAAGLETHASAAEYEAAEAARAGAASALEGGPGATASTSAMGSPADGAGQAPGGVRSGGPVRGGAAGVVAGGAAAAGAAGASGPGPGEAPSAVTPSTGRGGPVASGQEPDGRSRSAAGLPTVSSGPSSGRRGGGGRRRWPWIVALVVIVAVLGASTVLAYTTLPSAIVTIRPATETLGPEELVVRADPATTSIDVAAATIPGTSVEIPVEVSETFEATGKKKEETRASGSVTFTSKDPTRSNTIAAGSLVRTAAGVAFATRSAVTIPKAKIEGLTIIPGTATVRVTAVKGGPEGNVAPNVISVVPPAEDPVLLEVRNRAATAGGTRKTTTIVTQKDVDAAVKTLDKRLKARFADAAADPARAPEGTVLVPGTALLGPAVAEPEAASLVDQEIETFDLSLSARGSVTAYSPAAARSVALARLAARVPEGFEIVEGTATSEAGEATAVETMADVPTTSSASIIRTIDEAAVRELVRGKSPVDAATALSGLGEVSVEVWPSFFPTVTTSDSRIEIRIEPATDGPSALPSARPTPAAAPSSTSQ
jgi:hypothetical protein